MQQNIIVFISGCFCGMFLTVIYNSANKKSITSTRVTDDKADIVLHSKVDTILRHLKVVNGTPPISSSSSLNLPPPTTAPPLHSKPLPPSNDLVSKVSVLVWVMTQPSNLDTRAKYIKETWGSRVNKVLFVSDTYDKNFPTVNMTIPNGRDHLTAKTMAAFDYVYKHHGNDYDWFMKTDDDTYVIPENLRYFLSDKNPQDPVYFGHYFQVIVHQGYHSGGGGYVLSREALKRFGQRKPGECAEDHGAEDVEMGRCMEKHGVKALETIDKEGKTTFHCFNPGTHLRGGYPDWYLKYDKYGDKKQGQVSDYPITFHYVSIEDMKDLEYYTYHLKAYGK